MRKGAQKEEGIDKSRKRGAGGREIGVLYSVIEEKVGDD